MPRQTLLAAAIAALLAAGPAAAQVTDQTFRGGRTSDLATLCGTGEADPMRVAALAWCHGFMVAAGQYHRSASAEGGVHRPLFCLPTPEPTLEQARVAFVAWAGAHPEHAADRAIDGVVRFAVETYPCPRAATPRPRR